MQTTKNTIFFKCPSCHATFEFDAVGENEFIACPACGSHFITTKKGKKLRLEALSECELTCATPILL
jgi:Zn finger protein HypA/HybF involved in hydrogenase expression